MYLTYKIGNQSIGNLTPTSKIQHFLAISQYTRIKVILTCKSKNINSFLTVKVSTFLILKLITIGRDFQL
jgi:hypothetical protein